MKYSRDNMFTEKQDLTNSPAGDPYQDSTYGRLDLRLYGILIGVYSIFLLLAFYKTYYFLKKRGHDLTGNACGVVCIGLGHNRVVYIFCGLEYQKIAEFNGKMENDPGFPLSSGFFGKCGYQVFY